MAKSWRRALQSRRSGCRYLGWKGDENVYVPMPMATRRQISYIKALRTKADRKPLTEQEIAGLTSWDAFDMIERLTGKL